MTGRAILPGALAWLALLAACQPDGEVDGGPPGPAQRVVTLAPHLAELMFDLGAGDLLVGVSAYTDYPEQARSLPVVSDAFVVDRERLAVLDPDLLLAWKSGTPVHVVDQLRRAGYRVEVIETRGLADVAAALERLGDLTGRVDASRQVAARYLDDIDKFAQSHRGSEPIRVFYQISQRPLYSVNREHYISELVGICGGSNIFADIGELAPLVDVEAVIDRDPEAMLAGEDSRREAFEVWDRWPHIAANRYGNRFFMPAEEIGRPTTRLVAAAAAVCEALDRARDNRRTYLAKVGRAE